MGIFIENTRVYNIVGAVYSARNAMNSWNRSDSDWETDTLGKNDLELAMRLSKSGSDHRKFMRGIFISVDVTAPLYWWKEHDQYKVGTTTNSCSTMHKIHVKEFVIEDFSVDEYLPVWGYILDELNDSRVKFLETNDKKYWKRMIQLLPTSYNQKRTVMLNYEVLANMYKSRKNHKLSEWHDLCAWIEDLPYSELITGNIAE